MIFVYRDDGGNTGRGNRPLIFVLNLCSCRKNVIVSITAAAEVTQNVGIHPGQKGVF